MAIRLFCLVLVFIVAGCSNVPDEPGYRASNSKLPLGQSSFEQYAEQTRQWLAENRHFLTAHKQVELGANAPYELLPKTPLTASRGILLAHGLLDSPYSFIDIARRLADMGFVVRTVLLEGHGSKPANLLATDVDNWRRLIKEQVALFKPHVDELYLGGFSTGGNLVTSYALNDDDIKGLVLFSPGFKANTDYDVLAPVVPWFKDWVFTPTMKYQTNYVRYITGPSNAYAQYYQTSTEVLALLDEQVFDKPTFIALSETDSIIDSHRTLSLFQTRFTHPDSRLLWFGDPPKIDDQRVTVLPGRVPEFNVSNFSHMGLLFALENPYYGPKGKQRFCANGQSQEAYLRCLQHQPTWYSAYGYDEVGKDHSRLTFNPWFANMIDLLHKVLF